MTAAGASALPSCAAMAFTSPTGSFLASLDTCTHGRQAIGLFPQAMPACGMEYVGRTGVGWGGAGQGGAGWGRAG